jgi:hypothetical protein
MIQGMIRLPNGDLEFIRNADDFVKVVEGRMGEDAAQMVRELAEKADDVQQRLESDLRSYEAQLESQSATLREIDDQVHYLLNVMHRAKIAKAEKEAMLKSLGAIRSELRNHC